MVFNQMRSRTQNLPTPSSTIRNTMHFRGVILLTLWEIIPFLLVDEYPFLIVHMYSFVLNIDKQFFAEEVN